MSITFPKLKQVAKLAGILCMLDLICFFAIGLSLHLASDNGLGALSSNGFQIFLYILVFILGFPIIAILSLLGIEIFSFDTGWVLLLFIVNNILLALLLLLFKKKFIAFIYS